MCDQVTIFELDQLPDPIVLHRDALLRLPDVIKLSGLGRSAIYERMGMGTFPLAKDLGGNSVAWLAGEVLDWNRTRPNVVIRPAAPRPKARARS